MAKSHPFKNFSTSSFGSPRLQVSPWHRSCIPHGDACAEIKVCSSPLPSSLDGAEKVTFLCREQISLKDIWATKLRHFWARPLRNNLPDDLRDPSLSLTVFKQRLKSYLILNNADVRYSLKLTFAATFQLIAFAFFCKKLRF